MENLGLEAGPDVVAYADWYQVEPGYIAAGDLVEGRPDLTAIGAAST